MASFYSKHWKVLCRLLVGCVFVCVGSLTALLRCELVDFNNDPWYNSGMGVIGLTSHFLIGFQEETHSWYFKYDQEHMVGSSKTVV